MADERYESLKLDLPVPRHVHNLSGLFSEAGASLFVVGGYVRDHVHAHLHGGPQPQPKDVDLATELRPEEVMAVLSSPKAKKLGIRVFPKGEAFGIISALMGKDEYEIATFRQEWYDPENGDGRRPDKVWYGTPAADAARRDLTINALFYHLGEREVRDYNLDTRGLGQGLDDLRHNRVRTVGDPEERFREDKLRVMRFVRFFSLYNYGNILQWMDAKTVIAFSKYRDMKGVSQERIMAEFLTGLKKAYDPASYIRNLNVLALTPAMFTGCQINPDGIERIGRSRNTKAILAYLCRDNDDLKSLRQAMNKLKYPNEITDSVIYLLKLNRFQVKDVSKLLRERDLYKQLPEEQREDAWGGQVRTVKEFAGFVGKEDELGAFLRYKSQVKSEDFLHLSGPAIGREMARAEAEAYAAWRANEAV
jgi:tRNA nucleotidyltransferase/poly(A) polymerase